MQRTTLLKKLPPFVNRAVLIKSRQNVGDIMIELINCHQFFNSDYDKIANDFNFGKSEGTLIAIFNFLKKNIAYKEESEKNQTSKSPAAIIETGTGDCKHFSLFIGGLLAALQRKGINFNWSYRFASYQKFDAIPAHVFVVVWLNGQEIWIDPVLDGFNSRRVVPVFYKDKKIHTMALHRLSGLPEFSIQEDLKEIADENLTPQVIEAINVLLRYKVMNSEGQVNDALLLSLQKTLPIDEFLRVVGSRKLIHTAAMGGLLKNIWSGVKKVSLLLPRNAYLSMVGLNVFGLATKLARVLADNDGKAKLKSKWEGLGGNFLKLENTIKDGAKKKAVLGGGVGVAPAIPVWAATASAIIAALAPIIKGVLDKSPGLPMDNSLYPYGVCADGVTPKNPDGSCSVSDGGGGGGVVDSIKNNALLIAGAGIVIYLVVKKKKRA